MATSPLSNWYNWKIRAFVLLVNVSVISIFCGIAYFFMYSSDRLGLALMGALIVAFPVSQIIIIKYVPRLFGGDKIIE